MLFSGVLPDAAFSNVRCDILGVCDLTMCNLQVCYLTLCYLQVCDLALCQF